MFEGITTLKQITITSTSSGPMQTYLSGNKPWQSVITTIESITINSGVTSLGDYAFEGATKLTTINSWGSVSSIGKYSFSGCSTLGAISIPDAVTSMGTNTFQNCVVMPSVSFGKGLTSIPNHAFDGCTSLKQLNIPDTITSIGSNSFNGCTSVTSVSFNKITSIGESAFANIKIQSIIIPDTVNSIGTNAFSTITTLTSVEFKGIQNPTTTGNVFTNSNNVEYADVPINYQNDKFCELNPRTKGDCSDTKGECTFIYYHNSKELVISGSGNGVMTQFNAETAPWYSQATKIQTIEMNGIKTIGNNAFYKFTSIQTVTIPETVTTIGTHAFFGCNKLTTVSYPVSVKISATNIFEGCTVMKTLNIIGSGEMVSFESGKQPWSNVRTQLSTITIGENVKSIGSYAFEGCSLLTSINLNKVQTIDDYAFYDCINLESVIISDSTTTFGINPFINCTQLMNVKIDYNSQFKCEQGMILTRDETEILVYLPSNTQSEFIFLPDDITTIRPYAFYGNDHLELLVVPLGVTSIGNYAFGLCKSLQHVYYMGCNKQPTIGENVFEGTNIKKIKVKNGCGNVEFNELSIQQLTSSKTKDVNYFIDEETGLMVFYGNGKMDNYTNLGTQDWYKKGDKLTNIIFEQGVECVGRHSFISYNDSFPNIKYVRTSDTVNVINWSGFYGLRSLTTITIESSTLTFDAAVFWQCENLETIYYYGVTEPKYNTNMTCGDDYCGKNVSCSIFNCKTSDSIVVYVPTTYTGPETMFCGKQVTIKKELVI